LLLLGLVWRLLHGFDWRALLGSTAKLVACSLVILATLHWIGALGAQPQDSLASRAWFLFGQIAIGALVFLAVARILEVEELPLVVRLILEKFAKNIPSAPENGEAPIA